MRSGKNAVRISQLTYFILRVASDRNRIWSFGAAEGHTAVEKPGAIGIPYLSVLRE